MTIESWNNWLDKTSLCSHLAMLLQRISKSAALNFRPSGGSDTNLLGLWMIEEVYVNWDEWKIVLFSKNSWLYIASNT
jgi:glycine cleavage system protein P-like pyridoxal-binding family